MAEYSWTALLAEHGTTEAAWTWLRQNANRDDTMVGGTQELLDLMWREGLVKSRYGEPITMDIDLT